MDIKSFFSHCWEAILPVLVAICTFLSPIAGVLTAVGFFIATDMMVARWRTWEQHKKNVRKQKKKQKVSEDELEKARWTSRKARAGLLPKVITYNLVVLSFFLVDNFVINEFMTSFTTIPFALTKILALVLIWIELKSIDESFEAIKGQSLMFSLSDLIFHVKKVNTKIAIINKGKEEKDEKSDE